MVMLDRMQRRQAPSKWYIDFLKILYQKGYKDIVKEMEPDFTTDSEILKTPSMIVTDTTEPETNREEHDHILEQMLESNVIYLKSEIEDHICVKKMAPALCHLLDIDKVYQLMQIRQLSQKESIASMLESIEKLKYKTKWRSFISCLRESDYPHVADLLSRPRSRRMKSKEKELLKLFQPALGHQLDPAELVSYLEKENAINTLDKEEIMSTQRQSGKVASSFVLLACMQCRLEPHLWFSAFLKALVHCGREDIVLTVDPDYFKTKSEPEVLDDQSSDVCEADKLSTRIDKAHCHIYNLETSAKYEVEKIQRHFNAMARKLTDNIEAKTASMTKSLEDVNDMMKSLHSNNISRVNAEDVRTKMDESLDLVTATKYTLRPTDSFMKVDNLGVLIKQKTSLHRQNGIYRSNAHRQNIPREYINNFKKHMVVPLRKRHMSASSSTSSSSQSSGYLIVDTLREASAARQQIPPLQHINMKHAGLPIRKRHMSTSSSTSNSSQSSGYLIVDTLREASAARQQIPPLQHMVNMKHAGLPIRKRHMSASSSSSSLNLSSGYLFVEKSPSVSPSSSYTTLDEHSKLKAVTKVTFADNEITAQELHDMPKLKTIHHRSVSQSMPLDEYITQYSQQKTNTSRRRTVSESSIISSVNYTDDSLNSSTYRPCSSSDMLTDVSTVSSSAKVSDTNTAEKKMTVERNDSYLYHQKIVVNSHRKCQLSHICNLPTNKTVLLDQNNSCIYIYDDATRKFISHTFNNLVPINVCNIGESNLFILFRTHGCTFKLVLFRVQYAMTSHVKRTASISGITRVRDISSKCTDCLCSVASSECNVVVVCSDKHAHRISSDGRELSTTTLDVVESEWWPHFLVVDPGCDYMFTYDIYSLSVYCFDLETGKVIWKKKLPHVEGIILCGGSVYLSLNIDNKIQVLSKATGADEKSITENVRRPFAMSSSPCQDTIFVTQYHPKGNKINRTVQYF